MPGKRKYASTPEKKAARAQQKQAYSVKYKEERRLRITMQRIVARVDKLIEIKMQAASLHCQPPSKPSCNIFHYFASELHSEDLKEITPDMFRGRQLELYNAAQKRKKNRMFDEAKSIMVERDAMKMAYTRYKNTKDEVFHEWEDYQFGLRDAETESQNLEMDAITIQAWREKEIQNQLDMYKKKKKLNHWLNEDANDMDCDVVSAFMMG